MKRSITLVRTAEGHLAVRTDSWLQAMYITIRLQWSYGFKRTGKCLWTPIDETIYRDFVREKIRLYADWELLMGYTFLAANEDADAFLEDFFGRHA